MSAAHFFAEDVSGENVIVEGADARHALRVLRLRPGERVTVSDGRGAIVDAVVAGDRDRLVASVTARRAVAAPRPELHVFQAIPKTGKLDLVVQKLTELGVAAVHLFPAARSVPRWDEAKGDAQTARLAEVARQAAMQSRRAWLPAVLPPVPPDSLDLTQPAFVLDASGERRLTHALPSEPPATLSLVVGPEGGLSGDELTAFRARGATIVSMGSPILRTETAALAATALVLGKYDLLG